MRPDEVVLVGESNPYSEDPRDALLPWPPGSAGARLCRSVFGMEPREYLRSFRRVNLVTSGWWSAPLARRAAGEVLRRCRPRGARLVLLGSRVAAAFGVEYAPFSVGLVGGLRYLVLPHPSGRCRVWNDRTSIGAARQAVRRLLDVGA